MYLTQGLHHAVQQTPDRPATIFAGRVRTFAEQRERVSRLAGGLRSLGVQAGDRVAILALNSDRYSEYFLAVPWADAVVNPVNIRWSPTEIAYSLEDSGTRVLLVDDAFAAALPAITANYAGLDVIIYCGDAETPDGMVGYEDLIERSAPVEDAHRGGDALAGIYYTGGTTGFPKGVMLTHDNLVVAALGALTTVDFLSRDGRLLHAAPMFHLADHAAWIGQTIRGGTHVMVPMFEPVSVLAAIQDHQVTDTVLVPTMIQLLVDHPERTDFDTSGLRNLLYGGSPISAAVLERAMKAFPGAGFTQAYGMTEASPIISLLAPHDHRLDGPDVRLLRSGGRPALHSDVRIVDPDGVDVPAGEVGEIVVRGDHVTAGYWNKPDETAATIVDGWLHTGDAGRIDERGYVYVVDRIKDMIVTGGENVYSTEVENAIALHPAVASVAVLGLPDDRWGERVHAVVVPHPGAVVTSAEIREHTKTLIAGYKAPQSVEFAQAMPMTGTGKILKRELKQSIVSADAVAID